MTIFGFQYFSIGNQRIFQAYFVHTTSKTEIAHCSILG